VGRPRTKTPCNVWRKTKRAEIEEAARALAAQKGLNKSKLAALCDKVAKEMYSHLPLEERRKWAKTAEEQSLAAQAAWEQEMTSPPSKAPEDQQRCILGLIQFVQPILDLICEATGWKASCIAGGPEPAHGGKLNIISIHSGTTSGDVPLDFAVEECHACALKPEESLSLEAAGVDGDRGSLYAVENGSDAPADSTPPDHTNSTPSGPSNPTPSAHSNTAPSAPLKAASAAPSKAKTSTKMEFLTKAVLGLVPPKKKIPPRKHLLRPLPEKARPASRTSTTVSTPQPTLPNSVQTSSSRATSVPPDANQLHVLTPHCRHLFRLRHHACRFAHRLPHARLASLLHCLVPGPPCSPKSSGVSNTAAMPLAEMTCPESPPRSLRRSKQGRRIDGDEETGVDVPVVKRRRVSQRILGSKEGSGHDAPSEEGLSVASAVDTKAPKWFKDIYSMLQSRGMAECPKWMDLVKTWTAFEHQEGYEESQRLSSLHRPEIPILQFSEAYTKWWTVLQPEWRILDGKVVAERIEGDWETLRRAGLNGLVSVVVALFYWGSAAREDDATDAEWDLAVNDCLSALTHLVKASS
ncbi:hypothetical protein CVT26_015193, partial [Gymnopilus dilepis]